MPAATMAGIAWWNLLHARKASLYGLYAGQVPCLWCRVQANLYSLLRYSLKAKKPVTKRHWLSH